MAKRKNTMKNDFDVKKSVKNFRVALYNGKKSIALLESTKVYKRILQSRQSNLQQI